MLSAESAEASAGKIWNVAKISSAPPNSLNTETTAFENRLIEFFDSDKKGKNSLIPTSCSDLP